MNNTASITRTLKLGGLALAVAGSLAFGTAAAEASPAKVDGARTASTAGEAKMVGASGHGKKSAKRRKRCKAPKIAQRRRGRVRCVRPKRSPAPPKGTLSVPQPSTGPGTTGPGTTAPGTTDVPPRTGQPTSADAGEAMSQAVTIGGDSLVTTTNYYSPSETIGGNYFRWYDAGCSQAYAAWFGEWFVCTQLVYMNSAIWDNYYTFYRNSSNGWIKWMERWGSAL